MLTGTLIWVLMELPCQSLPNFPCSRLVCPFHPLPRWLLGMEIVEEVFGVTLRYGRLYFLRGTDLSHCENPLSNFPLECCETRGHIRDGLWGAAGRAGTS